MKGLKKNADRLFPAMKEAILDFQKLFDSYGVHLVPKEPYEFSSTEIENVTWLQLNYLIHLDSNPSGYFATLFLSPTGLIIISISSNYWWISGQYRSIKTAPISLDNQTELERVLEGMCDILAFRQGGELQANNMQDLFSNRQLA